jgi:hypothetical protein
VMRGSRVVEYPVAFDENVLHLISEDVPREHRPDKLQARYSLVLRSGDP